MYINRYSTIYAILFSLLGKDCRIVGNFGISWWQESIAPALSKDENINNCAANRSFAQNFQNVLSGFSYLHTNGCLSRQSLQVHPGQEGERKGPFSLPLRSWYVIGLVGCQSPGSCPWSSSQKGREQGDSRYPSWRRPCRAWLANPSGQWK